jgi:hypothetical protein
MRVSALITSSVPVRAVGAQRTAPRAVRAYAAEAPDTGDGKADR